MRKEVICGLAALASWSVTPAQAAEVIGGADEVIRIVNASLDGNARVLGPGDPVHHLERIATDQSSSGILLLRDDTRFIVGPSSEVTLDRFVFDPESGAGDAAITLGKGVMRFVTGRITPDAVTIQTPTAVIGIRGTSFSMLVDSTDQDVTHLTVEEGRVQFRSLTTGLEAELGPGQSIRSDATGGEADSMSSELAAAVSGMNATVSTVSTPAKALPTAQVTAISAAKATAAAARATTAASSDSASGSHY